MMLARDIATEGEFDVRIRKIRAETSEIRSFELEAVNGQLLPPFQAGAHISVTPFPGVTRHYSLVNDPADRSRYLIGVKRELSGRGGSSAMHTQLQEGGTVRIGTPRNNFALRPEGEGRRLLLAGGIGVTPLLSMAQMLASEGQEFELHYFARSNAEVAFRDLILESDWSHRVAYHYGLGPPLLTEVLQDILSGGGHSVYLCGPNPFMDVVRHCAETTGWSDDKIILEHFSAEVPVLTPGEGEFVVRLAKSGIELVIPSDRTIIEVMREAGVEIKTSCEQGVCGTCISEVVEGEVEHHDLFLSPEEQDSGRLIMPCVSRCTSRLLVLNI
ncbi:PDR/VanB family oxidoreductase [Pararhodobacter oceanensis]|uniref:PDR/VanB family oxidoreductase n=1 Tax=Pararhodobacter oceanensis TaxID=2172121 RepID=UPI003A8E4D22